MKYKIMNENDADLSKMTISRVSLIDLSFYFVLSAFGLNCVLGARGDRKLLSKSVPKRQV